MPQISVSCDWLEEHLKDPSVKIIDGSWHMPSDNRDARAEYEKSHIPGAVFFDIDGIADKATDLPHMLPSEGTFEKAVSHLGISNRDTLVIYDTKGLFSAPRVWWTFKIMGHENVYVLEGGLPEWQKQNKPVSDIQAQITPSKYEAAIDMPAYATAETVKDNLKRKSAVVLDARPTPRFKGEAPEPRPGLACGHIPGSLNLPFAELIENGRLKDDDKLREAFNINGLNLAKPVITTCGSGITAAILYIALYRLGHESLALYDGSWAEWGSMSDAPISTTDK
jgi:thiosulfate/3-mercaptopyruvate sulfurtransferase